MHSETVDWPEMANFIAENQTEDKLWTRTEVHVKYYDDPISRNVGSFGCDSLVDVGDYMINLLRTGNVENVTLKKL